MPHLHEVADPVTGASSFRATVASDLAIAVPIRLTVTGPAAIPEPDGLLAAGGYLVRRLVVQRDPGHVVTVRVDCPLDGVPPAVDALVLGAPPGPRHGPLEMLDEPEPVVVAPGCDAELAVTVRTRPHDAVAVDVVALSPFGSWGLRPAPRTTTLPPSSTTRIRVPVHAPLDSRPGTWWAMVVTRCLDQVLYSAAVRLRVTSEINTSAANS